MTAKILQLLTELYAVTTKGVINPYVTDGLHSYTQ